MFNHTPSMPLRGDFVSHEAKYLGAETVSTLTGTPRCPNRILPVQHQREQYDTDT
jgi:hypothetical protein